MSVPKKIIGIVGGAVSGSVFALQVLSHPLLRKRYMPVVYEQLGSPIISECENENEGSKDPISVIHTAGASLGIFSNGLFPLFQLGLRADLERIGVQMAEIEVWSGDLKGNHTLWNTLRNQGWDPDLESSVMVFERSRIRDLLLSRVANSGGSVQWHKKVVGVAATEHSRPRLQFNDGDSEEVDLLIGADGAWSPVRRFILGQVKPEDAKERWPAVSL